MNFNLHNPVSIVFGRGRFLEIPALLAGRRAFLIADPYIARTPALSAFREKLGSLDAGLFSEVTSNPECADADRACMAFLESEAVCIIGIGGGSAMDMSKITACAAADKVEASEYLSGKRTPNERAPLILVPTTAGTGSEVTNVSVMSGNIDGVHVKRPLVSDVLYGDAAVVDPALTDSMPPSVTAVTGFDAFCHAIETYWARASNPFSDMLAIGAVKLALNYLGTAYDHPGDKTARNAMSQASLMAGAALSQARTTLLHSISYPLTRRFHVAHGMGCALLLEPMIRAHGQVLGPKLDEMARCCGLAGTNELADAVSALYTRCGMPGRLSDIGVAASDIGFIVDEAMEMPMTGNNPISFSRDELVNMMISHL